MIMQQCVEYLQLNAAATATTEETLVANLTTPTTNKQTTTETLVANLCAKVHFHFGLYRYAA